MPDVATYRRRLGLIPWYNSKAKAKVISEIVLPETHGYDIGAGLGRYAKEMRLRGFDIYEIEPDGRYTTSPQMVEDVAEWRPFAYMVNVLHHADDPTQLLVGVKRIVGRLVISEVNSANLLMYAAIKALLPWERWYRHMDAVQLRELVLRAGWTIEFEFQTGFVLVPKAYNWVVCHL